ncbi:AAA family ATPase [Bdellovibrionales bacterium]|nr:AAA family ATPase [Bdellovibrionales bacterium]
MKLYLRALKIDKLLKKKSFFLFGPRATGKSTLIRQLLPSVEVIDLLKPQEYGDFLKNPTLLSERAHQSLVVIDEIQKLPHLLDEVHRLIENKHVTFLLTGSSARKLKRGGANLLAGRAWWAELFPLTSHEIPDFDLLSYLNSGGLPGIYKNREYKEELKAYVNLYLREEIQAEALTRNIASFAEFLELLALSNGEELQYQSLSSDCGVSPNTIKNYVQILEDTLVGFQLHAFTKTKKRKAISRSKFYYFDIGVTNTLAQRGQIKQGSELYGKSFEQFIIQEIRAYLSYSRKNHKMFYWRSTSQFEVDLIIGKQWAIEIKSSKLVSDKHLKGLRALKEEGLIQKYAIISNDSAKRVTHDKITIWPWSEFLKLLWSHKIIKE